MSKRFDRTWFFLFCCFAVVASLHCGPSTEPSNDTADDTSANAEFSALSERYINAWRLFYPSRAFASGDKDAGLRFEDFSAENIKDWLAFNTRTQEELSGMELPNIQDKADRSLLFRQIAGEIETWSTNGRYQSSPGVYAGLVSQAMTHVLVRDNLNDQEKLTAVRNRLNGIVALCERAVDNLSSGPEAGTRANARTLESTAKFLRNGLPGIMSRWTGDLVAEADQNLCESAAAATEAFATKLNTLVENGNIRPDAMGRERYAEIHARMTDDGSTPESLAEDALSAMGEIRAQMKNYALIYWKNVRPDETPPEDFNALVNFAIEAMEANRDDNQADFKETFTKLTAAAEQFVRDHQLGTVPDPRTLIIDMSPPHFAGAAVGGVYTAGPFNPEADTLFYLPSVPDDAPESAKENFYRSFNTHFNTMIISHEMFPGHYMQFKVATRGKHTLRALFADGIFVEGWGTFCELLLLDHGWDNDHTLTRLAHLRKILENAVRAYVSVKVHCEGWTKDQLTEFAVNEGLLAPQFAENLWYRALRSPHQLFTYFLGFQKFRTLYNSEKERLGEAFQPGEFVDRVLTIGAAPMIHLEALYQAQ